jgi:hypothetical protein
MSTFLQIAQFTYTDLRVAGAGERTESEEQSDLAAVEEPLSRTVQELKVPEVLATLPPTARTCARSARTTVCDYALPIRAGAVL